MPHENIYLNQLLKIYFVNFDVFEIPDVNFFDRTGWSQVDPMI